MKAAKRVKTAASSRLRTAPSQSNGALDEVTMVTAGTMTITTADRLKALEEALLSDASADALVPELLSLVVPVGRPKDFFKVHPGKDQRCTLVGLQSKDMAKTFYPVSKPMRGYLADYLQQFLIVRIVDINGEEGLYPIALPALGEEPNAWTQSELKAIKQAETEWKKLVYVKGTSGFKIEPKLGDNEDPHWKTRKLTFPELLKLGLTEFVITDHDHPMAIKLREGRRKLR